MSVAVSGLSILFQPDLSTFDLAMDRLASVLDEGTGEPSIKAGFQDSANVYLGYIRQRYRSAEFTPPVPWQDIAPATKYNRLRKLVGGFKRTKGVTKLSRIASAPQLPILYDTGSLYSSFVPGEPGYSEFWWPDGISMGSSVFYARYHQDGTPFMPARPILVLPDTDTLDRMGRGIAIGLQEAFSSALA
jgi:hypothetical protein